MREGDDDALGRQATGAGDRPRQVFVLVRGQPDNIELHAQHGRRGAIQWGQSQRVGVERAMHAGRTVVARRAPDAMRVTDGGSDISARSAKT